MELMHYPIRRQCLHWLVDLVDITPLALRLSPTLRAWTASEPWGNGKAAQGGVVEHFSNIKRIRIENSLGGRRSQVARVFFLQGGVVEHFPNIERIEIDHFLGSRRPERAKGLLIFSQGGVVEHFLKLNI
jgi:hypothetical protein